MKQLSVTVIFVTALVILGAFTSKENKPKDTFVWRLLQSEESGSWSDGWEGGSWSDFREYYYNAVQPLRPDSCYVVSGTHNGSETFWNKYAYTDYADYYLREINSYKVEYGEQTFRFRMLETYDRSDRLLSTQTFAGGDPSPDAAVVSSDFYSYDANGNQTEAIESRSYPLPFGPKKVTRSIYTESSKILNRVVYNVLANNLNNLVLKTSETWIYTPQGRKIAYIKKSSPNSYQKELFEYGPEGMETENRTYSSPDSTSWILQNKTQTFYSLSFGDLMPQTCLYYEYLWSDSTQVITTGTLTYSYTEQNRNITLTGEYSDGTCNNEHWVYNQGGKLTWHSGGESYQGGGSDFLKEYTWDTVVSNDDPELPQPLLLIKIYPNPFTTKTKICVSHVREGPVCLEIFNLRGQKVKTLFQGTKAAGNWDVELIADNYFPISGIYLLRLSVSGFTTTAKLAFLK